MRMIFLFSHGLHGFSQIFCCLGNCCLQMSGCVVRRNKSVFICGIRGRLFIRGSMNIYPWGMNIYPCGYD